MHGTIQEVLSGDAQFAIVHADNRVAIKEIQDESIDFVVADPCYAIGSRDPTPAEILAFLQGADLDTGGDFMSMKSWSLPTVSLWREHYRVLKPGAHLAVFCGPQTADLMSMAIRLAGFERRDDVPIYGSAQWNWIQGQGMKKGLDVSKAIDEAAGAEREVVGHYESPEGTTGWKGQSKQEILGESCRVDGEPRNITAASSPEAQRWDGFETDLASRHEQILIFRKPIAAVTSEQLRAATGWSHWHVVTDYRKPEARAKACAKWGVEDLGGDLQERDVRALDPEAESWRELRWREKGGRWVVLRATEPRPYKTWTICNVAANVLVYGTGAISIDRCRVASGENLVRPQIERNDNGVLGHGLGVGRQDQPAGRHPANCWFLHDRRCQCAGERVARGSGSVTGDEPSSAALSVLSERERVPFQSHASADGTEAIPAYLCLCGCRSCGREWTAPSGGKAPACECSGAGQWRCAVARLDAHDGIRKSGARKAGVRKGMGYQGADGDGGPAIGASEGNVSRYFPTFDWAEEPEPYAYCAKAPRTERDAGLDHRNTHVAVKPQKVLEYLVRLVGAPGAVGLTAWAGSGSEVAAMVSQGCRAIGIEWDAVHHADALQRVPALVRGERRRAPDPRREPTPKPSPAKTQPQPAVQQLSFL